MFYPIYYAILGSALGLSLIPLKRGNKDFVAISLLLAVTLAMELFAHILILMQKEFVWAYHLYNPVEYTLLSLYLSREIKQPSLKNLVKASVLLFAIVSLSISIYFYRFQKMPGINIGIESILVFALSTYTLFNLKVNDDRPIFLKTDFWICAGLLLFFGVCAFFFCIYTPLLELSAGDAFSLFGIIVLPLNLVLYVFINLGLLCSIPKRKYTTPY